MSMPSCWQMTRISTIRLLRVYTPDSVFDIIPAQNTLLCQDNVNVWSRITETGLNSPVDERESFQIGFLCPY